MTTQLNNDDLFPLDSRCPWCGKDTDVGETFDGHDTDCASCGKRVVAVAYDDFMMMQRAYGPASLDRRPNDRKATRARWQRQGRRG